LHRLLNMHLEVNARTFDFVLQNRHRGNIALVLRDHSRQPVQNSQSGIRVDDQPRFVRRHDIISLE